MIVSYLVHDIVQHQSTFRLRVGYLSLTHYFSVMSENITINHILPKKYLHLLKAHVTATYVTYVIRRPIFGYYSCNQTVKPLQSIQNRQQAVTYVGQHCTTIERKASIYTTKYNPRFSAGIISSAAVYKRQIYLNAVTYLLTYLLTYKPKQRICIHLLATDV